MPMNSGTAYLLLVAFGALVAFGLVEPLVAEVGASLADSAAQLRQLTHQPTGQ